jgi:hypothetical protein
MQGVRGSAPGVGYSEPDRGTSGKVIAVKPWREKFYGFSRSRLQGELDSDEQVNKIHGSTTSVYLSVWPVPQDLSASLAGLQSTRLGRLSQGP